MKENKGFEKDEESICVEGFAIFRERRRSRVMRLQRRKKGFRVGVHSLLTGRSGQFFFFCFLFLSFFFPSFFSAEDSRGLSKSGRMSRTGAGFSVGRLSAGTN